MIYDLRKSISVDQVIGQSGNFGLQISDCARAVWPQSKIRIPKSL
jgi:hypothetical protein